FGSYFAVTTIARPPASRTAATASRAPGRARAGAMANSGYIDRYSSAASSTRSAGNQLTSSSASGGPSRVTARSASMYVPVRAASAREQARIPGREAISVMSRSNPTVGPAGTEDAGDGVADTDTGADADTEGCGVVEAMPAIVPAAPPRPAGRLGAHRPAGRDAGGTRDSGEQDRGPG